MVGKVYKLQTLKNNMDKIQRQMLKNQKDIMFWISAEGNPYEGYFGKRLEETKELLEEK